MITYPKPIVLFQQDECAPDSLQSFKKDLLEMTGHTLSEFQTGEKLHLSGDDFIGYRIGTYQIRHFADCPYWVCEEIGYLPRNPGYETFTDAMHSASSYIHVAQQDAEDRYEKPSGCWAIVAVGEDGDYVMLEKPNLWMFEVEKHPQNNGFGEEFDLPPGVYRIRYSYTEHRDWESGTVDDWEFEPEEITQLWPRTTWWDKLAERIKRVLMIT